MRFGARSYLSRLTSPLRNRISRRAFKDRDWERLFDDPAYLRRMLTTKRDKLIAVLEERYDPIGRDYIERYLTQLIEGHIDNPRLMIYIESELGAPQRQMRLVRHLQSEGYTIKGKRCLDIGCSNGSLALACSHAGAADVLGIDISDVRLRAARELCDGTTVRLKNVNILKQLLDETFDVIMSTDVLEHVPDVRKLFHQIGAHLSRDRDAFVYIALVNKNLMRNVLTEPHYAVPGMILMPREEAKQLWYQVRDDYNSKLEYEVFHWHTYSEVHEMAKESNMEMYPFFDDSVIEPFVAPMESYEENSDQFDIAFSEKLESSPIPSEYKDRIRGYVKNYLDEFRSDHDKLVGSRDKAQTRHLFLKYYAEPLLMICRPAT